jgi:hypothetical protein
MAILKGNKEKRQKLIHILAGVIILVHSYEKYEMHENSYVFFLVAGLVFLTVALSHHLLAKKFLYVDGVFFVIEAVIYAVIAADYFHLGKKGLPWAYVFITIAYLVAAYIKGKKSEAKHSDTGSGTHTRK